MNLPAIIHFFWALTVTVTLVFAGVFLRDRRFVLFWGLVIIGSIILAAESLLP